MTDPVSTEGLRNLMRRLILSVRKAERDEGPVYEGGHRETMLLDHYEPLFCAALRDTGPRPDSGYRAEVHCCCCLDHCTRALSTPPTETSD